MVISKLKRVRFADWIENNDLICKALPTKILEIV